MKGVSCGKEVSCGEPCDIQIKYNLLVDYFYKRKILCFVAYHVFIIF